MQFAGILPLVRTPTFPIFLISKFMYVAVLWSLVHLPFIMAFVIGSAAGSRMVLAQDCSDCHIESLEEGSQHKSIESLTTGLAWFYCGGIAFSLGFMGRLLPYLNCRAGAPNISHRIYFALAHSSTCSKSAAIKKCSTFGPSSRCRNLALLTIGRKSKFFRGNVVESKLKSS
jgi:hypothetical protein